MKVVDRARLWFREGNSDKVYEVDLVEVATEQYVVNFRYGRRGSALRDGTKTPLPLPLPKARVVFDSIVAEKKKGGYQATEVADAGAAPVAATARSAEATDARTARELLADLARGPRSARPLHLVVRKVGELGLSEAEPLLLELLASGAPPKGTKPEVFRHFLIAALARCGGSRALSPLKAIAESPKSPRHLADVARLALGLIGGESERRALLENVPKSLRPEHLPQVEACLRELEGLVVERPAQAHAAIFGLYAATPPLDPTSSEAVRAARSVVLGAVRVARLSGQELSILRSLNWAAEIRRDGELFARLARRFEATQHDASPDTLSYFRRRSARALRRLASISSPDYVKMASELLLQYDESHAGEIHETEWGKWDAFARYHALNDIIYGNSPRYEPGRSKKAIWRCKGSYRPGEPPPANREEAYVELWDEAPAALWRLATSRAASVVIQFATRALRDNREYLAEVSDEALATALAEAQRPMQLLAFDVVRERTPTLMLARGALSANIEAADEWVVSWVEKDLSVLTREPELLALLITAKGERARRAVPGLTRALVLDSERSRVLVSCAIAILMQLPDEPGASDRALTASSFLLQHASKALDELSLSVARDLLAHAVEGVAELGAQIVLRRSRSGTLGDGLLDGLLASRHAQVRSVGARVVAETPLSVMKNEPDLLAHLMLSPNQELREGTRSLLAELAKQYPDVATTVATRLLDALLAAQPPGVPAHVVSVLRHELAERLPRRDVASVLALVGALSPHAREAGGLLVAKLDPDEVELEVVVRLASHEILLVRQGAWALARAAQARFRVAPVALARLCDARWDDSRAFAFEFVRSFPPADLVPDLAIAICDSPLPLVQQFGQSLLLEHFRDEHAARYLLRLSEHPSSNIQLLVSGLLDRFGRGNLVLLEQLVPCLITILSQVNRGGVAKQRVLDFLRKEAVASPEAAALLSPLLERQSLTRAVSHRGPLIATMVDVSQRYPDVAVPLVSPPVPVQTRGSRGV